MWMIEDNKVISDFSWSPKGVAIKYGAREGWDTAISAYPTEIDGYNRFFDSAEELCDLYIKNNIEEIRPGSLSVKIEGEWKEYDLIINTAPLDDLFKGIFSPLIYIGRRIEFVILPVEYALPKDVYFAYYTGSEAYTRVVEYKKFSRHKSEHTLISLEYPTKGNGKYYPMPTEKDKNHYKKYQELCHPNMLNAGRIGLYNYRYDIDDVMEQMMNISEAI